MAFYRVLCSQRYHSDLINQDLSHLYYLRKFYAWQSQTKLWMDFLRNVKNK